MVSFWPLVWVGIAIAAAVVEGLTVQLVSIWFAVSAAVTAVATLGFRLDASMQLLLFSLLGLALLVATRPFVRRKLQVKKERTNADAVVGKIGVVTKAVGDSAEAGRILVTGMDWSAVSADGERLEPGAHVTVLAIEGATLVVEPAARKTAQ